MQVEKINQAQSSVSNQTKREAQKQLVDELKVEWKSLWSEHFKDKVKAEGVSVSDYEKLHVSRGTIIQATRDYKVLNLKEILKENLIEKPEQYIQPNPHEGGWNKFIKTNITNNKPRTNRAQAYKPSKPTGKQPKKGGRGWLHK